MKRTVLTLVTLVAVLISNISFGNDLTDKLQNASVTIKAGSAQGSGVFITRKIEGRDVTFIITAGHVIARLKKTRNVIKDGKETKVVMFDDVGLVQEFQQDGRKVGETSFTARVLRYSDADLGDDLALLQVRKYNFTTSSVDFYLDEPIPAIGTELYHVGSLLGQVGANSLTTGIISQTGRVLDLAGGEGVVFDQTTATAFPGSSGGGVFLKSDGRYVGTLVRGAGEGFNLIVPIRRLRQWAVDGKVEWVVDPKVKTPTLEELKKIEPSDTPDVRAGDRTIRIEYNTRRYPFMISDLSKGRSDDSFRPEAPALPDDSDLPID